MVALCGTDATDAIAQQKVFRESDDQESKTSTVPDDRMRPTTFTEAEIRELDALGASDERFLHMVASEQKSFASPAAAQLPLPAREVALRFMAFIQERVSLRQKDWFEGSTWLDVSARAARGADVTRLPGVVVAIVSLKKKRESASWSARKIHQHLAPYTSQLADWLKAVDPQYEAKVYDADSIQEIERELLQDLEWRLNVPTIESWTSLFCDRLNVLLHGEFVISLDSDMLRQLVASMLSQPCTTDVTPRSRANGLFALLLSKMGLLPFDFLRPSSVSPSNWQRSWEQANPQTRVPECTLEASLVELVLEKLLAAMHLSTATLRTDASRELQAAAVS
jgi:hypothetical protein